MKLSTEITVAGQEYAVPVTLADRIVNYFDPAAGAARYRSRVRMAITGGYIGADKTRRANQSGTVRELSPDSAILPDLKTLRSESQHMARNNPLAVGAVKTNVSKVVGTGLKVKAQIDRKLLGISDVEADAWEKKAEREFKLATGSIEIDVERQLPFSLLQGLVFLKVLEDGDILVSMPRFSRPGSPYKIKLQLIEAARICNKDGGKDSPRRIAGVRKDGNGAPVAYQVLNQHPGSRVHRQNNKNLTWSEITAFGKKTGQPLALHLFDKTRPGQTRGVPYLAPVVELIKQLGRYTDAEVMAAVVSGMLTVFVTSDSGGAGFGPAPTQANPEADPTKQVDDTGIELGYGSTVGLLPGEKIETVNPGRPNPAFDPFVLAMSRQIGVALELPFELLVKHFTASYSAARAALEEAWVYFRRRRHWLVESFCQPVYAAVISEAIATGRLSAPGFFSDPLTKKAWLGTTWTGDAPSQIDPVKEIKAAEARIALRISDRSEECARLTGGDFESKLPRIIREEQTLRDNNLLADETAASSDEGRTAIDPDKPDLEDK